MTPAGASLDQGLRLKMTNHPNRSNFRYFKVSPRGFNNEVIYFCVPVDKINEVDEQFAGYEDRCGGYCNWSEDRHARIPGVAVAWADRAYVGF